MSKVDEFIENTVDNEFCSGCGVCAYYNPDQIKIKIDKHGKYHPFIKNSSKIKNDTIEICPFSNYSKNEDIIGNKLFGKLSNIKHHKFIGYYLENYAGYVKSDSYRENGSSGGMVSWIAAKLLEDDLVDGIIHVKKTDQKDILFKYTISNNITELKKGSKSKYYPIELSEVLDFIKQNKGRYALIGIPCFIKAVNLLLEKDAELQKRIKYKIGLVCGHLKSDLFAKSYGFELGIQPSNLTEIDFRVKTVHSASNYAVNVKGFYKNTLTEKQDLTRNFYVSNWGYGFFKLKCCDYCDDIFAETADITLGDAWLPKYVRDGQGTNVIIIRNKNILDLIDKYKNELYLDKLSVSEVEQSQSGGIRHRSEGLAYRLYLDDKNNNYRPQKRIKSSNDITETRKKIYEKRITLYQESFKAFNLALKEKNFDKFKQYMSPYLVEYEKFFRKSIFRKLLRNIKNILAKIIYFKF